MVIITTSAVAVIIQAISAELSACAGACAWAELAERGSMAAARTEPREIFFAGERSITRRLTGMPPPLLSDLPANENALLRRKKEKAGPKAGLFPSVPNRMSHVVGAFPVLGDVEPFALGHLRNPEA